MTNRIDRNDYRFPGLLVGVVVATVLILMPRQLRSRLRRFLVRVAAEALAVITLGLIAGKAADHLVEETTPIDPLEGNPD